MYDPLSSGFGADANSGWPSTPHTPQPPPPPAPEADAWQAQASTSTLTSNNSATTSPSTANTSFSSAGVAPAGFGGPSTDPFGREPKVYGQPEPGLISPSSNKTSDGTTLERLEPYLRVRITGMDRNRRDILIRFDAQTNLSNFTGQAYRNIQRSYFEFQQFAEQIIYTSPQTIIPALPLAQTSAGNDDEDDRLVRIMLQRWLSRICEDPILIQDEELRLFIESDFGYQPTIRPKRKAGSGFSLIKRGVPDEDEVLQQARFELTKLETQYFDVAKSVDRLARARRALAQSQVEMGNKLINVSTGEGHASLAAAFKKFGRTWHSLSDLGQAQAMSECVMLGDSFGYQGLNAKSAKETLMSRTAVLEEHQAAVKATIAKRRQIERLKASSNIRPDRVDEALEELEEASKYEMLLAQRVDGISQNLHRALHRHSRLSQEDVTMVLIENARATIMYEKQHLKELEALRPDFANAARKAPLPPPVKVPPPVRPLTPPRVQPMPQTAPLPPPAPQVPTPQTYTPRPPAGPLSTPQPPAHVPPHVPSPIRPISAQEPLSPSSPSAGPSTPRYTDASNYTSASKSMFITPTNIPTPLTPGGAPTPTSPTPSAKGFVSHSAGMSDPLLSPGPSYTASQSSYTSQSQTLGRATNGKGLYQQHPLAASMQVPTPTRRLDAREAAAKLANFL